MRRFIAAALIALLLAPTAGAQAPGQPVPAAPPGAATPGDRPWPRQAVGDGYTLTLYQPQVEKWDGVAIEARAAVSVETVASPQQRFGVVWFAGRTQIDKENHLVALDQVRITKVQFPSAPEKADEYAETIKGKLPRTVVTLSLDRLQANLAIAASESKEQKGQPLKNDPPKIFYSETPALLVLIDGKPVFRPIEGTKLRRAINTRALLLFDETSGKHYLRVLGRWAESSAVEGPWTMTKNPPAALETARQAAVKGGQVDQLDDPGPGMKEAAAQGSYPTIYSSTTPAELIQIFGQPEYEPIGATTLLHVKNTRANIVLDTATGEHYLLISGRWFHGKFLAKGPWEYVPHDKLPADFAKIPENHPRGVVLASVAGTPEAQEAVIDNNIPQTATVDRATTKLTVSYDGAPKLQPIEGTPLHYVVNAPVPVIQVDASNVYAVKDAVWFVSPSLNGPWAVATSVPAVIYTIPANSPMHYVTYVRVYGSTPQVVYVGYTPGYYGTVVAPTTVVVYGTGYYYPPYVGAVYYPYPPTYGYGAGFAWGAFTGFTFGVVAGAVIGGGGWGYHHSDVDIDIDRNSNINIDRNNAYNKWDKGQVKSKVQDRAGNLSPQDRQKLQQDLKARGGEGRGNDVYAGRDGNAYRRGQEGWERAGDQGGNRGDISRDTQQGLDRDQRARSAGEARERGYNQQRSTSRPSGGAQRSGGGGRAGGGGRGGRR